MATCARCGLRLSNVNDNVFDDCSDGADVVTPTTSLGTVMAPTASSVLGTITTPAPSLQSLARREIKGWGNETLVTSSERPPSANVLFARDLREVCVLFVCAAEVQTIGAYTCTVARIHVVCLRAIQRIFVIGTYADYRRVYMHCCTYTCCVSTCNSTHMCDRYLCRL